MIKSAHLIGALLVLLCVVVLACGSTCDAPGATQRVHPERPTTRTAEPDPSFFDPVAEVALPGSPTAHVLSASSTEIQRTRITLHLAQDSLAPGDRGRLLWLRAHVQENDDDEDALNALAALAREEHPLAPAAALEWAKRLPQNNPMATTAVALATATSWSRLADAVVLQAEIAIQQNNLPLATEKARQLLGPSDASYPVDTRHRIAAARILARLVSNPDPMNAVTLDTPTLKKAIGVLRLPAYRQRDQGGLALLEGLLRQLPAEENTDTYRALEPGEQLQLARTGPHPERDLRLLFSSRTLNEDTRCEAGFRLGKHLLAARKRSDALTVLENVVEHCADPHRRAQALYNIAREQFRAGHNEEAIRRYAELEKIAPQDSLADDARYKAALVAKEILDLERFKSLMASLPQRYPRGDMRHHARFQLAWFLREQAKTEDDGEPLRRQALSLLNASLQEARDPSPRRPDLIGRTEYWKAQLLRELDQEEAAISTWTRLTENIGLRYYGWLALNQTIANTNEAHAAASQSLCPSSREPTTFRVPRTEALTHPAFLRALEFARTRQPEYAAEELARWPAKNQHLFRSLAAALLHAAGGYQEGTRYARSGETRGLRPWAPEGSHLRLLFPRAFESTVRTTAQSSGIQHELAWAVMREESAFDTHAESRAGARGLMQLMYTTAERFVTEDRASFRPAQLFGPATNITLGTRFLGYLQGRFATHPLVIPAAYNAGEGATRRWLHERGSLELDEWVETIPYDETRRYTRRVLSSYAVYRCLDRGDILWITSPRG